MGKNGYVRNRVFLYTACNRCIFSFQEKIVAPARSIPISSIPNKARKNDYFHKNNTNQTTKDI